MLSISVVIPTLNEADNIEALLKYLLQLDSKLEIIVSDGGSIDSTKKIAIKYAKVISATMGRGSQMNVGANASSGDILWFLHADCHPHPDSIKAIYSTISNETVIGGGFEYKLDHPGIYLRLVEITSNLKSRLLKLLYGDMGIFVRKEIFVQMGGYKEIPLMEDMDFSKRLKRFGKIVILPHKINTSARRWLEEGFIKCSLRSWILQNAWSIGVSPHKLAKWYKFK